MPKLKANQVEIWNYRTPQGWWFSGFEVSSEWMQDCTVVSIIIYMVTSAHWCSLQVDRGPTYPFHIMLSVAFLYSNKWPWEAMLMHANLMNVSSLNMVSNIATLMTSLQIGVTTVDYFGGWIILECLAVVLMSNSDLLTLCGNKNTRCFPSMVFSHTEGEFYSR